MNARQPLPQPHHAGAAAIVGMQAGPPQFQQAPPGGAQRRQIIFILGIELPGLGGLIVAQQPVDPHHGIVAAAIGQDQVIEERIEPVAFQPVFVIDQRAAAAQFLDKDLVAQALRCGDVLRVAGQPHSQFPVVQSHRAPLHARRGSNPARRKGKPLSVRQMSGAGPGLIIRKALRRRLGFKNRHQRDTAAIQHHLALFAEVDGDTA